MNRYPGEERMGIEATTHADPPAQGLVSLATEGVTDRQLLECFVRQHDEVAFEALVQRHGPMVLAVCRRVLGAGQDADDAFQATFLVLVRRAASVGKPELLGNWLYGVAYRVARKLRAQAARRRLHESAREAVAMPPPDPADDASWRELRAVLDEELQHLPPKFQAPLVLCYLEGLTNEEAARRLGWPVGSISYRLARARELLRSRLAGRCRALSPAVFAGLLAGVSLKLQLPRGLVEALVRAAPALALGKVVVSIPRAVLDLAEEVARAMSAARWRGLTALLMAVLALLLGGAVACAALAGRQSAEPSRTPAATTSPANMSPCH
jgi:RNA polymerase sigma factor (sigma-70 family)